MKKIDLVLHLTFHDECSEEDVKTISQNVINALCSHVDNSEQGLAPEENITDSAIVSHKGIEQDHIYFSTHNLKS